jgi:fructokinase
VDEQRLDLLAIGETLIDLISDREQESLGEARSFRMYPGGQATNVALNIVRLGGSAALVARTGDDTFGKYLRQHLDTAGVGTAHLLTAPQTPTTLVVVTRQSATPDFAVYRGADAQLLPDDMPLALLSRTSIVHTSAFALSREPSCSTVLDFVKRAHEAGCLISFDPNYHPRLWELQDDPASMFAKICQYVSLTKPSLDDCVRLFGDGQTPERYASHFLAWGARQVVLTMGAAGVLLVDATGTAYYPTRQEEVIDVTGAGDSFWAGLLVAILDGYPLSEAIRAAQAVAAIKLQQVGPLSMAIDRANLYARIGLQKREKR